MMGKTGFTVYAAVVAVALAGAPAVASQHEGHGAMAPGMMADEAAAAFKAANARMHEGMAMDSSGNADIDFARGMIVHHQGALDMARTVLEYGSDPEIRKMAEEVVLAQEAEISFMQDWLKRKAN